MHNPLSLIGEAFAAGLEKLHGRADTVEADMASFKSDVETFKTEIGEEVAEIDGLKERLAKIEAMLSPDAVSAATDKVSGVGASGSAPTASDTPSATEDLAPATPDLVTAVVAATSTPEVVVQAAADAHAEAAAAGIDPVSHATDGAVSAGADPATAQTVAQSVDAHVAAGFVATPSV